ncbi:peptide chain release factor N(5)-glutamine methyltransferase [Gammaproteobacteria bacterium AB-CW1]|uniref:Release factor glutamine methyltransferase n=1 Tax=Natronospira elongata TaxID=3110268 RepID=A0AAP6JG09_9GAMM|nr:peptide chain release factor N(5)-glutamine methyltransferase [Gammaproteobacteria bacterium AB-CW1]
MREIPPDSRSQTATISELLSRGETLLQGTTPDPRREARLLLRHASGLGDAQIMAFPERQLTAAEAERYLAWVRRRARHEPIAHLLGWRDFRQLSLRVDANTLIPRPETELLVDLALDLMPAGGVRALDLGTGSGAIALCLADERPAWSVSASDESAAALSVARDNAQRLGLKLRLLEGDWFEPVTGERFDLIVSNPPYIPEQDPHLAQGDLPHEPRTALAAGDDGLDDLRRIIREAPAQLTPNGRLMLEHGHDQGPAVRALLDAAGLIEIATHRDLAGRERISTARRGGDTG